MKIIIFAGGAGTRLWPLSRKKFPKQFIKMFDGKSTLELAVSRVIKTFGAENIYVSTNDAYVPFVENDLPHIPKENIFGEPAKRNVAPAIGYALVRIRKQGYKGPIAILWADHLMDHVDNFIGVLQKGKELVKEDFNRIVFVGEKARYAENNLGWIHVGDEVSEGVCKFIEWRYKPPMEECKKMYKSGKWFWNPGYFIADIDFLLGKYKELAPKMYSQMVEIESKLGTDTEMETIRRIYPQMEKVSFDKKILENIPPESAVVVKSNMGWSDPGTLYALKEANVGGGKENFTKGLSFEYETEDCLVVNEDSDKLIVIAGLKGYVIVNTHDVLLVVPKEKVLDVTDIVEELGSNPNLEKFI